MGIVDAFSREDRVEVKFSDFYGLMKQAAQYEIAMNAVNCDVPHAYIRETMTGKKEDHQEALLEATDTITPPVAKMGVVEVKFDGEEFRRILEKAFEEHFGPDPLEETGEDPEDNEETPTPAEDEKPTAESILEAAEQEQENTEKEPPEITPRKVSWKRQRKPPAEGRKENETW